ncbi:MAG: aspartate-semialdehyde dehydrogenase [Candidatus Paraimprobicoccus trichonymphae]|uniref:Aspartate-semialdehyde dehydrogenase n=1 Tax=Candidatus Paraimprobicoccus trichonymphae TaxID=3033793 RepID=A0AA48KZC8_9FIRM|nr:MAG: aspartate-semialdehyde dehydrogenase [Candidatus Paraimprobicoccus trichonymphae]
MRKFKVGILGATGMVGQKFMNLLENHPWFEIKILAASYRSANKTLEEVLSYKTNILNISVFEKLKKFEILDLIRDKKKIASEVDFVFCAININKLETKELEESYAKLECPVISNNSANRLEFDIPMVIPEINPEHLEIIEIQKKRLNTKKGFIAVKSNCSIQCYVPAIHSLLDLNIKNILVCTYQAISGAGKTFENWSEMRDNLIPYISGEEEKSEIEPLKIWGKIKDNKIILNNKINITSQCFRIPITDGHAAAVFVSFEKKVDNLEEIISKWNNYNAHIRNLKLPSAPKKFLRYFSEPDRPQIKYERDLENGMGISIGRLRKDTQFDIKFVSMSHNTVRGAAGGAILLAELLCYKNYI